MTEGCLLGIQRLKEMPMEVKLSITALCRYRQFDSYRIQKRRSVRQHLLTRSQFIYRIFEVLRIIQAVAQR